MADAFQAPQVHDLRTQVPEGWIQSGLSGPNSDGVNVYRTPLELQSALTFNAPTGRYFQYQYQLFSPSQAVTAQVSVNGQLADTFTFPPGQFQNREASGFLKPGQNTLTVSLSCQPAPCRLSEIHQYGTRLTEVPVRASVTTVGLGVERWWLDAPGSPLSVTGTGALKYDNVNFLRYFTGQTVQLGWPAGTRVINVDAQVAADQPFVATFLVGQTVIERAEGDAATTVAPTLSLVNFPKTKSVTIKVACLKTPALPCARLYFTRVAAVPASVAAPPDVAQLAATAVLIILALMGCWLLLNLPVRRAA